MTLSALRNVPLAPRRIAKYAASFFKREWTLDDYPILFRQQKDSRRSWPERFTFPRWIASIDGWVGPSGMGDTKEEAVTALEKTFLAVKANSESLPRPGTYRSIAFASSDLVDCYPELRDDFIRRVLGLDCAFVSDESSLWDFHVNEDNGEMYLKIGEVYGVDVSHIEGANLAKIFAQIMEEIDVFPEDFALRAIRLNRDARERHILALAEHPWNPY